MAVVATLSKGSDLDYMWRSAGLPQRPGSVRPTFRDVASPARHSPDGSLVPQVGDRAPEYPEGQINAMRSTARLIAVMPPSHVARQVARIAGQLSLDYSLVTEAVTDAVSESVHAQATPRRGIR
jgi:hypothetical protein